MPRPEKPLPMIAVPTSKLSMVSYVPVTYGGVT
jgi:hypothetical protein